MFNDYVKVRKSEVKELEKAAETAITLLKELDANVDKLKRDKERLEEENVFLKGLIDKLTTPARTYPNTFGPSEWPTPQPPHTMKGYTGCTTCGITGANGYVCPRTDCPSRVTCHTK